MISSEYWRGGIIGLSELKRKIKSPLSRSKTDPVIIPKVIKSKFLLGLFGLPAKMERRYLLSDLPESGTHSQQPQNRYIEDDFSDFIDDY